MLSSGGLTHVAEAERTPVQMLESGPAAGALAAAFFGRDDSGGNLLAFDMGGTTAKLSLVDGGEPLTAYASRRRAQKRFLEGSGLPIRISTIELIEIGAGGGSIAHVDEIGLLKVGPRSAGSQPGPASYGLGGTRADRDRRRLPARLSQSGLLRRRRDGASTCRRRARRCERLAARVKLGPTECRLGHPRHRQREHGRRGPRAHRRARPRSARLRAALHRRRRARARLLRGEEARAAPGHLPAGRGRGLRTRPPGGAGPRRPRRHRRPAPGPATAAPRSRRLPPTRGRRRAR